MSLPLTSSATGNGRKILATRLFAAGVAALLAVAPLSALAHHKSTEEASPLWKDAGRWDIRVDNTLDGGCFMITSYEDGVILRTGFNPSGRSAYVMLGDPGASPLEVGRRYQLSLHFERGGVWDGEAVAITMAEENSPALFLPFGDPDLWQELRRAPTLQVRHRDRIVTRLSLMEADSAVREMFRCQQHVEEARMQESGASKP